MFGVFLSIGIGNESGGNHVEVYDDSLWNTVILALLEIIGGFACGILVGIFLWLVKPCNPIVKGIIAFITSFAMVFPSSYFGLSGLGYLATITSTAVASIRWGSEEANKVDEKVGLAWKVL